MMNGATTAAQQGTEARGVEPGRPPAWCGRAGRARQRRCGCSAPARAAQARMWGPLLRHRPGWAPSPSVCRSLTPGCTAPPAGDIHVCISRQLSPLHAASLLSPSIPYCTAPGLPRMVRYASGEHSSTELSDTITAIGRELRIAAGRFESPITLYEQPSLAVPHALDRMEFLGHEL